jgi:hypothetical protein
MRPACQAACQAACHACRHVNPHVRQSRHVTCAYTMEGHTVGAGYVPARGAPGGCGRANRADRTRPRVCRLGLFGHHARAVPHRARPRTRAGAAHVRGLRGRHSARCPGVRGRARARGHRAPRVGPPRAPAHPRGNRAVRGRARFKRKSDTPLVIDFLPSWRQNVRCIHRSPFAKRAATLPQGKACREHKSLRSGGSLYRPQSTHIFERCAGARAVRAVFRGRRAPLSARRPRVSTVRGARARAGARGARSVRGLGVARGRARCAAPARPRTCPRARGLAAPARSARARFRPGARAPRARAPRIPRTDHARAAVRAARARARPRAPAQVRGGQNRARGRQLWLRDKNGVSGQVPVSRRVPTRVPGLPPMSGSAA